MPIVGAATIGAVGAIIGFGLGFGVATIAKPVLLAERYDTRRYATLAGELVVPATLVEAAAPGGLVSSPPVRKGSRPYAHPLGVVVNRPSVWPDR